MLEQTSRQYYESALSQLQPSHSYKAWGRSQWANWRDELTFVLKKLLTMEQVEVVPLAPQTVHQEEWAAVFFERILISTEAMVRMPVNLYRPKSGYPPYPALLFLHGHKASLNVAATFASYGYLVIAPMQRGFDKRSLSGQSGTVTCSQEFQLLGQLGMNLTGLRLFDAQCAVDYLLSRSDVVSDQIGVIGWELGGDIALFLAGFDTRIMVTIANGALTSPAGHLNSEKRCVCDTVPGLFLYADPADIAGLIAPRPLLIETPQSSFELPLDEVLSSFKSVGTIYASLDSAANLDLDVYPGQEIRYSDKKAIKFLYKFLINRAFT
ncbi:MAG: dienelactone hydrolase family protein [Armatimonadetes bacterium]|nr:dienelactone hydrolase family protein [Armatimonadota bacterium]